MRPRDLQAARQPPLSLPAGPFGPWAEAGALDSVAPLSEPFADPLVGLPARLESGRLDILCLRPIHHVLEYEALYQLTAALRSRLPGVRLHLHLRSALRDPRPFARLPADRVERLASRGGRGMLAAGLRRLVGQRGRATATVVLAPPAGCRQAHPAMVGNGGAEAGAAWPVPLGFQAPGCRGEAGCAAAGAGFLAALFDELPLWRAAAGAPPPLSRRVAGHRFLVHQARFHVGDTLWITPLLRRIHALYRRPQVTLVGPPVAAELLAGNPHLAELICHHPADGEAGRRRVLAALDGQRFDAALFAFARRHESAWLARAMAGELAGAGRPPMSARRINLEYHDLFQDSRRPWGPFTHEAWFFWGLLPSPRMLLHALDPALPAAARMARRAAPDEARLELHPTAAARRRAAELLAVRGLQGRPFAVLAPGGHSSPRWPAASYARLAVALAGEMRLAVLIEGSPEETPLLREVAAALAEVTAPAEALTTVGTEGGERPPIAVCQDPLDVFGALLERARVLIGNDSGPLHLAAALGVPSLYFAAREKLAHSHPEGTISWALFDELANDPRRVSVAQALGALREMRRQGLLAG